ncbi:transcriptional regulator, LacI family [Verrucomicrobium sp. GAS474]|uniref:LacI family DNA-binding transcriptional regulator n=1 Tax=Verrucomicrobium sp. GAS474 TaxID=1882831 RepID=UPI000879C275|nr:LacI family DNA-binding transcriptional regulator [Verrucomicrobium sp. GAS474]SDT88404.1 transcriptional regulator, LacI family [Verrucomicrobium sp. GAS474]
MATLKALAQAAGVSIRTINRVLKGKGYVGTETREAVEAAVRKLGYRPNLAARSLKTAKSHIVSVLAFAADEPRLAQVAGLERRLREAGFIVSVAFHFEPRRGDWGERLVQELLAQNPAGVVLVGSGQHDPYVLEHVLPALLALLVRAQLPYVILDPRGELPPRYDAMKIDRGQGVREAVLLLAERGRKRIAFLGPTDDRTRLDGYEAALRTLGRKPLLLDYPGEEIDALREAGRTVAALPARARPDAVVIHADHIALSFLAGLHDRGVRVPEEIALVGFDDRSAAALAWPPLTTIAQPAGEIGKAGAEVLLAKIAGEKKPKGGWSRVFSTRLIVRETT